MIKLQRTTLVLILLAILLGGFVYFYEFQWKSQQQQVKKKQQQLFSFKEEDVKALRITTPSETIVLERSPESSNTKWLMKSPDTLPANDSTVAYLLSLLDQNNDSQTTPNQNKVITTSTSQLSEFGLAQPQATIDFTLKDQKTYKLALGKPNFDNSFLYAQNNFATKPDAEIELVLVSKNFENAIKRPLSEWKAVENSKTTPSPSPEATPTNLPTSTIPTIKPIPINPTPQISQTPAPTTTPTPVKN